MYDILKIQDLKEKYESLEELNNKGYKEDELIKKIEKKLIEDIKNGVDEAIYLAKIKELKEKYKLLEEKNNIEIKDRLLDDIKNRMLNGDNVEIMKTMPKECIDLVVTSPPYDDLRDYEGEIVWNFDKFKEVAKELYRVMKPGGVVVWVVGDKIKNGDKSLTSFKQAIHFQDIGFKIYDVIIYEKTGTAPPHPNRYFNAFEYMFVLTKGKGKIKTVNVIKDKENKWGGHETYSDVTRREKDGTLTNKGKKVVNKYGVRTNIWRYVNGKGFAAKESIAHKHPAIFPEKLAEDHIISWSNEGDLVLDPFGGSGTTIKAAKKLNRNWIYIDKVCEYCEVASERMKEAFGEEINYKENCEIAMDIEK